MTRSNTLSICMIVRDEAALLPASLSDAAQLADELIVVDTGSRDGSKAIARRYTEKVYDFSWRDDFAAARNVSFSYASGDMVMWLDADDRIDPPQRAALRVFLADCSARLVLAGYERPENGGVFLYPRIVRRDSGFHWEGIVHEHLTLVSGAPPLAEGDVVTCDAVIRHAKPSPPNYARNIALMARVAEAEFRRSFWLCAQCYLDCILAGERTQARHYLALAEQSETPFPARIQDYALINRVLKFHQKREAMLWWNALYLRDKKRYLAEQSS